MPKRVPWAKRTPTVNVDQLLRTIATDGTTKMLDGLRAKPHEQPKRDAK